MAVRDKNFRYQVEKWEGLIQHILFLASRGYTRIHVTYLPLNKKQKWDKIDEKMYRRYQANLTRGQVDYRRKLGYKVYKYFRWKNVMVLMSTRGNDFPEIEEQDAFLDLKTGQEKVQVSERLFFIFYFDERKKFTVRTGNETLEYWKQNISYHLKMKHKNEVFREIKKIDYIPSYSGVYKQKVQLRKFIFEQIKKNGVKFSDDEKKKISFSPTRYQINVFARNTT